MNSLLEDAITQLPKYDSYDASPLEKKRIHISGKEISQTALDMCKWSVNLTTHMSEQTATPTINVDCQSMDVEDMKPRKEISVLGLTNPVKKETDVTNAGFRSDGTVNSGISRTLNEMLARDNESIISYTFVIPRDFEAFTIDKSDKDCWLEIETIFARGKYNETPLGDVIVSKNHVCGMEMGITRSSREDSDGTPLHQLSFPFLQYGYMYINIKCVNDITERNQYIYQIHSVNISATASAFASATHTEEFL